LITFFITSAKLYKILSANKVEAFLKPFYIEDAIQVIEEDYPSVLK